MDTFSILLGSIVPSQFDFPNLHLNDNIGKLRGKFQRLMLSLPSMFPSKLPIDARRRGKPE